MLNILIVDDSMIIRRNIKKHISVLGHNTIAEAKTGMEAITLCKQLNPDLITMDITMPEMDGITAVKKIREFNKDVNIVMVTSHGQEEMVAQSLKAGAKGYILKPITADNFAQSIGAIYEQYNTLENLDDDLLDDY